MIRINLAQETAADSVNNSLARDFLIVAALCAVIYLGVEKYSVDIDEKIAIIDSKIEQQNSIREELKKEIAKSAEINEKVEIAKSRGEQLKQLGQGRKSSVIILDHLQIKHPERMWFDRIKFSNSTKQLELSGFALDHAVIADYMKRLKDTGQVDVSDIEDLRDFIPKQLQTFSALENESNENKEKNQIKSFEVVDLKSLKSALVDGVTLQRFEIIIQLKNG
ncbi:MAG: hypothetical protein RJB13_1288 [Pseudomonadota bacterium]